MNIDGYHPNYQRKVNREIRILKISLPIDMKHFVFQTETSKKEMVTYGYGRKRREII